MISLITAAALTTLVVSTDAAEMEGCALRQLQSPNAHLCDNQIAQFLLDCYHVNLQFYPDPTQVNLFCLNSMMQVWENAITPHEPQSPELLR